MSTHKPWVTGPALEIMLSASLRVYDCDTWIPIPGVFQAGDEVLVEEGRFSRAGEWGVICTLVERPLRDTKGLRVQEKAHPSRELWCYWDDVIGWRRP